MGNELIIRQLEGKCEALEGLVKVQQEKISNYEKLMNLMAQRHEQMLALVKSLTT